jgi:uncharacterized protein (DUF58 family)
MCWAVGSRYGWAELIVAAVAGGAMLLVASLFAIGRTAYEVTLDLPRLRVKIGEVADGGLAIRNASPRRALPAQLELPVGDGLAVFALPGLRRDAVHEQGFRVPTNRRAVIGIGPVRSARGDALGLVRRELEWEDTHELFVHPKIVSLAGSSSGFLRDLEGRPTSDLSSSDVAFHALREYVVGDDRRHIHWKTSARIGKFMVRQFEETRRSHLAIALSTNVTDYANEDELELAISAAASLGVQAKLEDKELTVLIPGRRLHNQTSAILLDDCSRIRPDRSARTIESLARAASVGVPDASVAVLCEGSPVTANRLRAAITRFGVNVVVLVIQCQNGQELTRRTLGGALVLGLGDLADLPRGLRTL